MSQPVPAGLPAPDAHGTLAPAAPESDGDLLRAHAEQAFAHELAALAAQDDALRPPSWRLSPRL